MPVSSTVAKHLSTCNVPNNNSGSEESVNKLLDLAKEKLEDTQEEVVMVSLLGVMEAAAKNWPNCFAQYFEV